MDTTEQYILMCEKAEEIQKTWVVSCGDYCVIKHPRDRRVVIVIEGDLEIKTNLAKRQGFTVIFPESYGDNKDFKFLDTVFWLPRQDQLQAMVPSPHLFARFMIFLGWDGVCCVLRFPRISPPNFTSMEQLWLAFVMREKFKKIWDSKRHEWVLDNSVH